MKLVGKNSKANSSKEDSVENLYQNEHQYIKHFDNAEDHYRDLIENASDIIYRTDLKGDFVYVNTVAAHLMEYSIEELLAMNYLDLVASGYKQKAKEFYINQIAEGKTTTYFEFPAETKSGKIIWFGQNVRIIKTDGKWVGIQALARDITDRYEAEQKLKFNEERFGLFARYAPAAVAMFDTEMCYMAASNRWLEENDIDADNFIGKSHYKLFPQLSEDWKEIFSVCLSGVSQQNSEDRIENPDGSIEWLKWEVHPWWKSEEEIGGIIVYTENITRRKEIEQELLKARAEAEQASAAKSSFIASMSHEFRTPLNAVMGFADILKSSDHFSEDDKELLDQIHQSGSQLLSMINDVIDISRIETTRLDYKEVEFALEQLLMSSVEPYLAQFQEKGIGLAAEIDGKVPRYISTDLDILEQILGQLLSNALKFTDAGKVKISARYEAWNSDSFGRNGLLFISVADTGIGFEQKDKGVIFKPFTKLNDVGPAGTGLGLTLVTRLCRFLGGTVEAESKPGKGSTFTISIPVKMLAKSTDKVEVMNFTEQVKNPQKIVRASEIADFIKSLDPAKANSIINALELQQLDEISKMDFNSGSDAHKEVIKKLTEAVSKYDFAFLNEVLKACKN